MRMMRVVIDEDDEDGDENVNEGDGMRRMNDSWLAGWPMVKDSLHKYLNPKRS